LVSRAIRQENEPSTVGGKNLATLARVTKRSDDAIRKDVAFELEWDPMLSEQDIGVVVKDGVLTLTGTVPSVWMKLEAEKAAKRVYGVRGVANDIQLNLTTKRTDSEIGFRCEIGGAV
jgi:osmotically-inducible protein OsmY